MSEYSPMTELEAAQVAPLTLAYLGDTVYDLYVRTRLVRTHTYTSHVFHRQAIRFVSAVGQSASMKAVWDRLTPWEQQVAHRGRNAKPATVAKNAPVQDYHMATGFEALLGALYLTGNRERLETVMDWAWEALEGETECLR